MKKFKNFILFCILSALCVFSVLAFTGCKSRGYVNDRFEYKLLHNVSGSDTYHINGTFKVNVKEKGDYTVTYTVYTTGPCGTQKNNEIRQFTADVEGGGEYSVMVYCAFPKCDGENNSYAKITNVRIFKVDTNPHYSQYAIGFGIAGGVILVTAVILAVVLFVLKKSK